VGEIKKRRKWSFGTFPCYKTPDGRTEPLLQGLQNPFWIADFRDWQVVNADIYDLEERGFQILALEKPRPHVDLPRAIMVIRFSDEFFGTQFHPEADAEGMAMYFKQDERKNQIISDYGQERYEKMLEDLEDYEKIEMTFHTILPNFFRSVRKQFTVS
jgi:GMP synthase-like glutamine amidotransferase